VQVVAPELVHSRFQSPYPFSFFWQVSNRFLVACRRRSFRISETRKLDVGDAAITSWALHHAFIRESLFAFACPSAVLAGELENFPIRIPRVQALLPDSRFWWTLSRFAPWSQCSTHPRSHISMFSPQVLVIQRLCPGVPVTPLRMQNDTNIQSKRPLQRRFAGVWRVRRGSLGGYHPCLGKTHQRRSSGFRGDCLKNLHRKLEL
jgi:hypothetical protein